MRAILHSDLNSCYASIEVLHHPELRGKPVAVGGDVERRHGIILAKTPEAKRFGVKTGEALWQAREKCPGLIIVPPHYDLYWRFSQAARAIYCQYTDQVEPFGLDEAWLDVTGSLGLFGSGETIAQEIRRRMKQELGLTVSIGVSYNKIFAKLGSDYQKPDAVTVISKENYRSIAWPLPVGELLYVGPATRAKLDRFCIRTIGDLAQTEPRFLGERLGKMGYVLHTFANGWDATPVARAGEEQAIKSVGNGVTAVRDLKCEEDARIIFYLLAESVAERLRELGFACRTVQIGLRDFGLTHCERQMSLGDPTNLSSDLAAAAMALLRRSHDWRTPLRSVSLRACDLVAAEDVCRQLSFYEDPVRREKREKLESAVDDIRRRYGRRCIHRAILDTDRELSGFDPRTHTIHPVGYFKPKE